MPESCLTKRFRSSQELAEGAALVGHDREEIWAVEKLYLLVVDWYVDKLFFFFSFFIFDYIEPRIVVDPVLKVSDGGFTGLNARSQLAVLVNEAIYRKVLAVSKDSFK